MSYTCPVCKTNYERQQDCGICGFSERPRLFLSKSQARNWFDTEVLPRRRKYENSLRKPVVVEKPPLETEKSSFEEREFGNSFPNRTHSRREEYSWRDDLPKASRDKNSAIIEPKEITIEVGQIGHFNVRDALNKDSFWTTHLIWSSSDERVATVAEETLYGYAFVTAVSAGTTTITGKSIDGGYNNVSGKVTVLPHRLFPTIVSGIMDDYIPSLLFAALGVFPLFAKSIIETSTAFLLVLGVSIAFTILMRFLKSLRVNFNKSNAAVDKQIEDVKDMLYQPMIDNRDKKNRFDEFFRQQKELMDEEHRREEERRLKEEQRSLRYNKSNFNS